jgi:hypothetical protein
MAKPLIVSQHAYRRMRLRQVTLHEIFQAIESGDVIEDYPDDLPYPSKLICWKADNQFLHLVIAERNEDGALILVTVYRPELGDWEPGFTKRRGP